MSTTPERIEEAQGKAGRVPLGVDISDYSDEFCTGFLAGQSHVFDLFDFAAALREAQKREAELRGALAELLDVAERIRGDDTNLNPERWYAARDFARSLLADEAKR